MKTLKVFHWNILAGISADNTPMGFPYVEARFLDWKYRKPLIISMIKGENPDLISLVEVDKQQRDDLISEFGQHYEISHHFKLETTNPSDYKTILRWEDTNKEGSMILVRKGIFDVVVFKHSYFPHYSQLCNYIELTINDITVIFVSLHLKAKANFTAERIKQVRLVKQILASNKGEIRYIIAGDFNDEPDSMPIKMMSDNYQMISDRSQITTFKRRKEYKKATIDYIFGSYNLMIAHSDIPKEELVHDPKHQENAFPCADFPSDHLYLIADILL